MWYGLIHQHPSETNKLTGIGHYKHSSYMASTQLMANPTTLMTALSLSVSPPQVLFLPSHTHSEAAGNTTPPKPLYLCKGWFLIWDFQRYFFSQGFFTSGYSQEAVGQQPPKYFYPFLFYFFIPPPASHTGAKLGVQV